MNREVRDRLMRAGRADAIPNGSKGLWYVHKLAATIPVRGPNGERAIPPGNYTLLSRWTDSNIHLGNGETVMVDNPIELRTHLAAAVVARGQVLVTGLGLACVVRMMQQNPQVERITVIESSRDVIDLVWPYTPHDRVELVHAEALSYIKKCRRKFDFAWHDVWTDTGAGEPHLAVLHQRMMLAADGKIAGQGAWAFPRDHKRKLRRLFAERRRGASMS